MHRTPRCRTSALRDVLIRLPNQEGVERPARQRKVMASAQASRAQTRARSRRVRRPAGRGRARLRRRLALLLVIIGIVVYLAMRFEWRFAVSAIIANLHDVIIILGFFAFFQWEFSLPVLAAVPGRAGLLGQRIGGGFDRVRETFRKNASGLTTPQVLDHAITSTISRTIITHGSAQMMVLSMLLFRRRDAALLRWR